MKIKKNPYSTELAYLRDYLKRGFDPYDYAFMLERFFDEERGGEVPDWFDHNEPESRIVDMDKETRDDFKNWALSQSTDALSPSTAFYSFNKVVERNTWLIHFSDHVSQIIKEGFVCGHEDMYTLGLTTWFDKNNKCNPGWNFAFKAGSSDSKNGTKYGTDAVIFKSAGVSADHNGDNEEQVIFWGPSVKTIIPLWNDKANDVWYIKDHDNRRVFSGDFDHIIEWVKNNASRYEKRISYFREG